MRQLLKLIVSSALVALAIYFLDVQAIIKTIKAGSAPSFVAAVVLDLLAFSVMGLRWYFLAVPAVRLSLSAHMAVYFRGTFLNTFTPANLGGDAYRLAVLKKNAPSGSKVIMLLLRERIIGLYGYVIVFMAAYLVSMEFFSRHGLVRDNPYVYGIAVALFVLALPLFAKHLGAAFIGIIRKIIGRTRLPRLESIAETLAGLLATRGILPLMLLTFIGVALWVISIKTVAEGFGLSVSIMHLAAVATLVEIIRLVPITVQGVGLREGAFAYLLAFWGHSPEHCYAVGTIAYLALSAAIVLSGPVGHIVEWASPGARTELGDME